MVNLFNPDSVHVKTIIIGMIMAMTFATSAWADDLPDRSHKPNLDNNWYAGLALGTLAYRQDTLPDFRMDDRRIVVGKQWNRYLGTEVHLGGGVDDTESINGIPVHLRIDNYVAGFIKGSFNVDAPVKDMDRLRVYGLLGVSRIKATSDDTVFSQSGAQTRAAFGMGLELIVDRLALQLGYLRYVNGSANGHDYTLDSLHLGVMYEFAGD
ncbi:MAG: outer membrane beta-barrel protein [Gammaproteobacteria bacterium]|nr:outer membrane beta-barrel protein [Gammaproteobacteria bacterium]